MTLVTLPSPIYWPGLTGTFGGNPALNTVVNVSATGNYCAYIICAKEDMTISHVGFRIGITVTSSPQIECRIETVDASGLPSGTLWAANTTGTTGVLTANSNTLQALTASASITKGQVFCVKLLWAAGTACTIGGISNINHRVAHSLPYAVTNTGSPTKATIAAGATLALGSSSTTFYQIDGFIPISAISVGGFNNTNSAKRGLRFTPPMNCRAIGIRWHNSNATGDFNAVLYNDGGTELSSSSTAFDGDYSATSAAGTWTAHFDNTVTLTAGTTYRIAIEPTSATNVNVSVMTLVSANYRSASPAGTTAHYTTFASASWTDTATDQLPLMDLIIDQVDDGTGSGGSPSGGRVFGG